MRRDLASVDGRGGVMSREEKIFFLFLAVVVIAFVVFMLTTLARGQTQDPGEPPGAQDLDGRCVWTMQENEDN